MSHKLVKFDLPPGATEVILNAPAGSRILTVERLLTPNVVRIYGIGDPAAPKAPIYAVALGVGDTSSFPGDLIPIGQVAGLAAATFVFQGVLTGLAIGGPLTAQEKAELEALSGLTIPTVYTQPGSWIQVG